MNLGSTQVPSGLIINQMELGLSVRLQWICAVVALSQISGAATAATQPTRRATIAANGMNNLGRLAIGTIDDKRQNNAALTNILILNKIT